MLLHLYESVAIIKILPKTSIVCQPNFSVLCQSAFYLNSVARLKFTSTSVNLEHLCCFYDTNNLLDNLDLVILFFITQQNVLEGHILLLLANELLVDNNGHLFLVSQLVLVYVVLTSNSSYSSFS